MLRIIGLLFKGGLLYYFIMMNVALMFISILLGEHLFYGHKMFFGAIYYAGLTWIKNG